MAEVAQSQRSLLTSKWGPMPVWAWAGIGLVAAWLYAKWRSGQQSKTQAAQQADTADAEPTDVAPQFIIENNMPGIGAPTTPQAPITTPAGPVPVTVPPGKSPSPPGVPVKKPPPPRQVHPGKNKKPPLAYKVKSGDKLSTIAERHHTTWQALWTYNTTPGNRPADTIKTLKDRGPDLIFPGETILIPQT